MSDNRTVEQREADEALRAAVEMMRLAYGGDQETFHLTDFLVMYAARGWDEDGDDSTAVGRLVGVPAPSVHAQIGLLQYGLSRLTAEMLED